MEPFPTCFTITFETLYYAEKSILKSLPKLERAASNPDLIPARQLIDSSGQAAGWYKSLISRAAAPPTPRAYQSAFSRIGIKAAFARHREETEGQVERLQKVFELLGKPARAKTCEAINGITEEANELLEDSQPGPVRDAGLVAAAQAVEHYEISRYGAMIAWAKAQQLPEIVQLLEQTPGEEKKHRCALEQARHRQDQPGSSQGRRLNAFGQRAG